MKKLIASKKLKFFPQTIRTLQAGELLRVAGGENTTACESKHLTCAVATGPTNLCTLDCSYSC